MIRERWKNSLQPGMTRMRPHATIQRRMNLTRILVKTSTALRNSEATVRSRPSTDRRLDPLILETQQLAHHPGGGAPQDLSIQVIEPNLATLPLFEPPAIRFCQIL